MPTKTFSDTYPMCPRGNCNQGRDCNCGEAASACTEIGADDTRRPISRGETLLIAAIYLVSAACVLALVYWAVSGLNHL